MYWENHLGALRSELGKYDHFRLIISVRKPFDNEVKDLSLPKQTKNIVSNIGEAFSNAVKKGTEKLSFPDGMKETVKEGFEKID